MHVYGQSLPLGVDKEGAAQHIGLGTLLLRRSEEIARAKGFSQLAVIAAIGTRQYYASRGFRAGELYMIKDLVILASPQPLSIFDGEGFRG